MLKDNKLADDLIEEKQANIFYCDLVKLTLWNKRNFSKNVSVFKFNGSYKRW